jgi:hypothetical protein
MGDAVKTEALAKADRAAAVLLEREEVALAA